MATSVDCTIRYTFPQVRARLAAALQRELTRDQVIELIIAEFGSVTGNGPSTHKRLAWLVAYKLLPAGSERVRRAAAPAAALAAPVAPLAQLAAALGAPAGTMHRCMALEGAALVLLDNIEIAIGQWERFKPASSGARAIALVRLARLRALARARVARRREATSMAIKVYFNE